MATRIAEYLGQRTDLDAPTIIPSSLEAQTIPSCPFMGGPCSKIAGRKRYHPICSVRTDQGVFVVCSDRLVPAKARVITPSHISILAQVASHVFPGVHTADVAYRRQVGVRIDKSRQVYLDYVLAATDPAFLGRRKVILEVQGGGETSNTGTISESVNSWATDRYRTNALLRRAQSGVGIIPNNAWKRQLEQVFRKAPLAGKFQGAFALVMGHLLFEYVRSSVPGGRPWYPDWEVALIELVESDKVHPGSIDFEIGQAVFMSYAEFVNSVSGFPIPEDVRDPFIGSYTTLHNESIAINALQ